MSSEPTRQKTFLFVDDEAEFLFGLTQLLSAMSKDTWEIITAQNHARALELLSGKRVDVVVLDIGMPVMDGLQFLRLLARSHPGQQVVMLTGHATPEARKSCLENGAVLFLEKPATSEGFKAVFAALDSLAGSQPQAGFRGMMRRVGLQDVLQMECLSRKSSILEVFTPKLRGRIFISDGSIVHADSGALQGEVALYGLLALRGGEFNFLQFTEPPRRTISSHWESLLMEAARLMDEGSVGGPQEEVLSEPLAMPEAVTAAVPDSTTGLQVPSGFAPTQEIVLCSGAGEPLFDWNCPSLERRLRLLEQVETQGAQMSGLAPIGALDRLEVITSDSRIVCQARSDRRLFVRSARGKERES